MITYCEFDEGKQHHVEAEYLLSKRDGGKFRAEAALCDEHLIDYALSNFRWEAIRMGMAIIVCHSHMRQKQAELEVTNIAPLNAACYLCLERNPKKKGSDFEQVRSV